MSKMLENHVHDSLMTYLASHKLLYSTQYGFRFNHSFEGGLLQIVNKFLEAIDNSQIIRDLFHVYLNMFEVQI